jgi:hypothetical protein
MEGRDPGSGSIHVELLNNEFGCSLDKLAFSSAPVDEAVAADWRDEYLSQLDDFGEDVLIVGLRQQSQAAYTFLCLCGMNWNKRNVPLILYNVALLLVVPATELSFGTMSRTIQNTILSEPLSFALAVAVTIQFVGILVCVYCSAIRLNTRYRVYELQLHRRTITATVATTICSFAISVIFLPFALPQASSSVLAIICGCFAAECIIFGGGLHFLFVDVAAASAMLQSLRMNVSKGDSISVESIEKVRSEINRIVHAGYTVNTALIATALCNVFVALALFILVSDISILFLIVSYMFKEVIVAVVGLYRVACVNELYFALVDSFGGLISRSTARSSEIATSDDRKLINLCLTFQYLQSRPIKFPLVGLVLTRKDVILRFSIWFFGIFVSSLSKAIKFR